MVISRLLKPLPLLLARGAAITATACNARPRLAVSCLRQLSSSSWSKFASATGAIAPVENQPINPNSQSAAMVFPDVTLSQKQRKIVAVVERALHSVLTRAVSPPHLSRYIAYVSMTVLTISRDCYVVTIGWDCLEGTFPASYQQDMQVC
jgi:hypothetical protein